MYIKESMESTHYRAEESHGRVFRFSDMLHIVYYGAQVNTNNSEYANLQEICSIRAEVTCILLLEKRKSIFKHIKDTVKNEQKEISLYCHEVEKKKDLTVPI